MPHRSQTTTNGLVFPDVNTLGELFETDLIMPEPTIFLSRIVRPTEAHGATAGAVKALTDDGLFIGQPPAFFAVLHDLAAAADAAPHAVR